MNGDAHSAANGVGSSAREPRIAIVGAGLTGLATAQGLRKIGIQSTVFERDTDINARPRDWSILLHWARPILENMVPEDIRQKLSSATCNPHLDFTWEGEAAPAYNGLTGNLLFTVPHVGARRISRQAMRRVLAEGIDIKWGKNLELLTATESCIRLTFGDDDVFDADFVIGADGVSSKVRELLLGVEAAKARMAGLTIATTLVRYGDVEKIALLNEFHPVATMAFIPNGVTGFGVLSAPDPNDMLSWTMFWAKIWKGSVTLQGQEALDYVKKNTQGVCEPFQSAINWTPDGSHCYADEMKYWVPVPWNNHSGRVTIIGDAAHPMLPYRGQGLQHAIADASNYVNVMAAMINKQNDAMSREKIMTDFDTEMIDRGAKAVAQAISEAELSLDLKTVEDMIMARQGLAKTA